MWAVAALLCALFGCAEITEDSAPQVVSLFDAFRIPDDVSSPYDTAHIKVLYPQQNSIESQGSPLPVVIFLSGVGVEANRYQWLAERLVRDTNVVVVLFDVLVPIAGFPQLFPGSAGGIDFARPNRVLVGMFSKLEQMNSHGPLAGKLNLNRVILGGHSAGGVAALVSSNEDFFPEVVGMFGYGVHLGAGYDSEHPPGSILHVGGSAPILLLGGDRDGVIMGAAARHSAKWKSATEPIKRTYDEAFDSEREACFVKLRGFNHFSIVDPVDKTAASMDLDFDATVSKETMKDQLSLFISLFVQEHGHGDPETFEQFRETIEARNPYVGFAECKP